MVHQLTWASAVACIDLLAAARYLARAARRRSHQTPKNGAAISKKNGKTKIIAYLLSNTGMNKKHGTQNHHASAAATNAYTRST
jgi:hypothetical protein